MMKKYFARLIALVSIFLLLFASGAIAATNRATWVTDSVYIDSTGVIYAGAGISMGGTTKTSFGSIISPWEDDGTTTTLTSAPTKFILTHGSGTLFATIGDFNQINLENDAAIDNAADGTVTIVEGGDTLSLVFTGNDIEIENSDGGIIFDLNDSASDATVDFMLGNDNDDYIQLSTTTNQPLINFVGCNGSITAASGTISFGDENLSTTGTASTGATTVTSLIIGDDTYDVVTDDQFRFASNDEESTIEAYGFEAKDAVLQLTADEGDDAGDKIQLVSDQATNSLFFTSDTAVKDTHATILTLAKTGLLTTTNDIYIVNDTATTNAVVDVLKLEVTSTGTAAAGLGAGLTFAIEDEATSPEQQGSIDVAMTDSTDSSEDADMIFSINTAGAIAEVGRFVAASSATTGDSFTITSNTTETNAITDILSLANVTGTATHNAGLGITWDFEDATGAEEQASLDVQLIVATNGQEDVDFIFKQQTDGAVTETFRIVGQAEATTGDYVKITQNTQETDAVLDILVLTNVTGTATTGAGLGISFQPEDATGAEEQASIDAVFTDAIRASADVDFVFRQNVAGAIEERVRFDADDDTILLTGTTPKMTIGDAGTEDTILAYAGNAQTFHISLDDSADDLVIGLGEDPNVTPMLAFDEDLNVTVSTSLKTPYQIVAATETLTENESMKLIVLNHATEFATTLPDVASSAGVTFHIVVGLAPAGTSYTVITEGSENTISGVALVNGASVQAATEDTITFTASAAAIGDWVELTCDGVLWYVSGQAHAATGIVFTGT